MMIKLLLTFVLISFAHANIQKSEFKSGQDTYSIQAVSKWITSPGTFNNLRIDYTVRKNGKTIHSTPGQGGVLLSCSYGRINDDKNLPKDSLKIIKVDGNPVGWWVSGFSVCGNTTSLRTQFVLPIPQKAEYGYFEINPKTLPVVTKNKNDYEIWFIYQEWGNGGTAGSFFVPRRIVFEDSQYLKFKSIGIDPKIWPSFDDDFHFKNFPSIYVSGVLDKDPEVMKFALDNYFKTDADSKNWYEWSGVPVTKEKAVKEIEAMSELKSTLSSFNNSGRGDSF